MKLLLSALGIALGAIGAAQAQTVPILPNLFGINYWYYDYASGIDNFNTRKVQVKEAGITFVRLGGNAPNRKLALADMQHFDLAIERVYSIGATPLMQLPINLAPDEIAAWVSHFRSRGIRYWTLGNEPDPSANYSEWYRGVAPAGSSTVKRENGNTYAEFRNKFVALARALKAADPQAIVTGPDFRQWFGTSSTASSPTEPLLSYYPAFIDDVGVLTENGVPLLDIFAFHFYGGHSETENRKRASLVQSHLNRVNLLRATPLRMAVGEVNGVTGSAAGAVQTWGFDAGQFLVTMTKNVASFQGEYVAPWSVYENSGSRGSTDFSTFNSNGSQRSTLTHFSLLAKHRRAFFMAGAAQGNAHADAMVQFGMTDAAGTTAMLMNTSASARTFAARLDDQYPAAHADVQWKFASTGLVPAAWAGTLPPKTSFLFTFDADGRRLKKIAYDRAISDAAPTDLAALPVVTDLTLAGAVAGSGGVISLAALLPQGAPRSRADFYVDDVLAGSASAEPFTLSLDSTLLVNGTHKLLVTAIDGDGNADNAVPVQFVISNPVDVTGAMAIARSGLVYNRSSQLFHGSVTLTNVSGQPVPGPIRLLLAGLPAGIVLANASGTFQGAPYLNHAASLAASASATFMLSIRNPAKAAMQYTPLAYSGSFQ